MEPGSDKVTYQLCKMASKSAADGRVLHTFRHRGHLRIRIVEYGKPLALPLANGGLREVCVRTLAQPGEGMQKLCHVLATGHAPHVGSDGSLGRWWLTKWRLD